MGANHSHSPEPRCRESHTKDGGMIRGYNAGQPSTMKNYHIIQGKPSPPYGIPVISDITHNSLLVTWQPPKLNNGGSVIAYSVEMFTVTDKQWVTLTKTCQGSSYKVRNLNPDSEYQFRIRAENIFGRSKPGSVSELIQMSSFDVHDFSPSQNKVVTVKRRHSLNTHVPVEAGVATILSHSSPVIETTSATTESHHALQRDNFRSSLQNNKKRSGSSLIPGTKSNSLQRLRTSQSKLINDKEAKTDNNNSNRNSMEESVEKMDPSGDSDARSDIGSDCNTCSQSSGSEYLVQDHHSNAKFCKDHHQRMSDELILGAPVCDDLKLALYSKNVDSYTEEKYHFVSDEGIDTSGPARQDFRTLRSMLQSSDVIIKPTQSLPEISDMCRGKSGRGSMRNKLTTIIDEEDDDAVKVTTL